MESGFDNIQIDQYIVLWLEHAKYKHTEKPEVGIERLPDGTLKAVSYANEEFKTSPYRRRKKNAKPKKIRSEETEEGYSFFV